MLGKNQKQDQKSQEVEHKISLYCYGGDGGSEDVIIKGKITYRKLEKAARDWVRDLRWADWNFWPYTPEPRYVDFVVSAVYDYGEPGWETLADWIVRMYPSSYKIFQVDDIFHEEIENANYYASLSETLCNKVEVE